MTAAGVVAAAIVVLTGCGGGDSGDSGDSGNDAKARSSGSPHAGTGDGHGDSDSGGKDPSEDAGTGGVDAAKLEGAWSGTTDGKKVDLAITGKKAALISGGQACTGEVADHGKLMLSLKCVDGSTGRTMGTVESGDGKTLVISWGAGTKDTLVKAAPGVQPEGIPSEMLKDLPKFEPPR
ncbi:hypothetical protein NBG84_23050 [Streptomyces sp. CWNU-1]|uniref:Lipoprotein n=2 Tax=Streptomyces albipurpureus TaxID=2897419 RepID=A0ABT0UT23_9ACTN|nr:hypothetical protein [Streptomyces sp. CWNU-1]